MKKVFALLLLLPFSILFCLPGCDKEEDPISHFQCATPAPPPPAWIFDSLAIDTQTKEAYALPLYLHIVRDSSGNGLDNSVSDSILHLLNKQYKSTGIQFLLTGSDYMDNNYYYDTMNETKAVGLMNKDSSSRVIHLYILGTHTYWSNGKQNQSLPRRTLIIHGGFYHTDAIIQEMRNCLELQPTE